MVGLTAILKEAWNTSQQTGDKKRKDIGIIII
jgi:hypothetical protein